MWSTNILVWDPQADDRHHRWLATAAVPTTDEESMNYFVPRGGLPPQTDLTTDRAVFTAVSYTHLTLPTKA